MQHDEFLGFLTYLLSPTEEPRLLWALGWELVFWALLALVTLALARLRPRWILRAEERVRSLSQHKTAVCWSMVLLVIVLRLALLPVIPVPMPVVHDEYSFLLGADTFASGHITNPTHPMWTHFETFHVNMLPTYHSMYPPAQAVFLAIGQRLTGCAWAGVLLSVALMCGALCWMLQGWLPPQWALLGGVLAVLRFGIFCYWMNSYFGGAVAGLGGALLLGALPRLRQQISARMGLVFVLGLLLLANSRPMEGFLFSIPVMIAALIAVARDKQAWPCKLRALAPAVALLSVAFVAMLYYNYRCTGRALEMPYMLNQRVYHITRPMFLQKPYPIPAYRHQEMRNFYVFHEYPDLIRSHAWWGVGIIMEKKFYCYYTFFVWPMLLLFLPGLLCAWRNKQMRVAVVGIMVTMAGLTAQIWPAHGHYAAPILGALLLLFLNLLYELPMVIARPWTPWLRRAIVLCLLCWMAVPTAEKLWNPFGFDAFHRTNQPRIASEVQGTHIKAQLEKTPGEHLVFVHYIFHDVPSQDWVYNRADIDHAKIVWARDMGDSANAELLRYYPNRKVWWVDHRIGMLVPYPGTTEIPAPARP